MTQNIVRYTGLDDATLDTVSEQADNIAGGDFEDIEVGENVFRVLPVPEGLQPIRVTAMHYIDALPGHDKMIVFACPRVELKEPCIGCAEVDRLLNTGNPLDREKAERIGAKLRVYANVLNRRKPNAVPKVLGFGKQVWDQLKAIRKNQRTGGDYTDPTANGFDIVIMREGTGRQTKYVVQPDRANSPLAGTVEEINEYIGLTKNLNQFVQPTPPPELLAAWGQQARGVMAMPPAGQLAQGTRMAAQQAMGGQRQAMPATPPGGVVGAGVMRRQAVPGPAPVQNAVLDAEFDEPAPAAAPAAVMNPFDDE